MHDGLLWAVVFFIRFGMVERVVKQAAWLSCALVVHRSYTVNGFDCFTLILRHAKKFTRAYIKPIPD